MTVGPASWSAAEDCLGGLMRAASGWTVRSDLWGRGYATEIGRAGLSFAFDELGATEVVAFTEPHNRRSRMLMERLGMVVVGDIVLDGDPFVLYRIRRDAAKLPAVE
jgi:ribosomal-protein-alanine N-acetyltransferase